MFRYFAARSTRHRVLLLVVLLLLINVWHEDRLAKTSTLLLLSTINESVSAKIDNNQLSFTASIMTSASPRKDTHVKIGRERDGLKSPDITKVLLMTYYRGGSSFLGQIFAQNTGTFYWFEPLDSEQLRMGKSMLRRTNDSYLVETDFQLLANGSLGELPQQTLSRRTEILANVLTCKATALSVYVLSGQFLRSTFGKPRLAAYVSCLQETHNKYELCAQVLENTCLNSTTVVAKVIRYPMYEVRRLVRIIPDLKVIHYLRDPRATTASRAGLHGLTLSDTMKNVGYLCAKMAHNLNAFNELRASNPENYLQVKYEDLALETKKTARQMYDFIGCEFTKHINAWIEENTKSQTDGDYGTRRNSTESANRWRGTLQGNILDQFTRSCDALLKALKYPP